MGYNKTAQQWMPVDITSGEYSVNELRDMAAADKEACDKWATGTWTPGPSLTAKQIKVLDGPGKVNGIGMPESLESGKNPAGFSEKEYVPTGQGQDSKGSN